MYQVLARKFRPGQFDELIGQGHIARTLSNAIGRGRIAHAYLFTGQRGTGKTTVARILAKCLNCETGPTARPCDACAPCVETAAGRAMDVIEIDAASRTKVEQTRELLDLVAYAPARDRHKILIIDEVHMLSSGSSNALLKTLEEPPPNVVFVLATTELQKILPTIQSRCQVFEFRRVSADEIAAHLRRICDAENVRASDASLARIARVGDGSVRDALSVLERVVAFSGAEVDDAEVLRLLGGVDREVLERMVQGLAHRDAAEMVRTLDRLVDDGHDLQHFWHELISAIRDLLLMAVVPDATGLLGRSGEEAEALRAVAAGLGVEDLNRAFQILADLESQLRYSTQPRFVFESALIRLASLGTIRPIEEVLATLGGVGPSPEAGAGRPPQKPGRGRPLSAPQAPAEATPGDAPAAPAPEIDRSDPGGRLVAALLDARPMVGAILQQAEAIELGDRGVEIRFPASHDALARQLARKESLRVVEEYAGRVFGRPVGVTVHAAEAPPTTPSGPPPSRPERPARSAVASPRPPAGQGSLIDRATSEPGVSRLLREFGAQVVDIRPLDPGTDPAPARREPGPLEDIP
jgi:DNA polymerase-3 subunit gamma/tau